MIPNEMAPAIGGIVFTVTGYLYALHIRRKLDRERAKDVKPAE